MNEDFEVWRPVAGFSHYEVSNMGRVRSTTYDHDHGFYKDKTRIHHGRVLRPYYSTRSGYLFVSLMPDGGKRPVKRTVHRLVARAFVDGFDPLLDVNHINEIKTDNRAANLNCMTRSANMNWGTGNARRAETQRRFFKPVDQYTRDGVFLGSYVSQREAERHTGVRRGNIRNVAARRKGNHTAGGFVWRYKDNPF